MNYYEHARTEVLPHLPAPHAEPMRLLEVGCGAAGTLARIRQERPDAWLAGVEIVPLESPAYATLDQLEPLNIEEQMPQVDPGSLDVLMCLDVLEHLRDPGAALQRLAPLLKPRGRLIVSLPNIQYIKVSVPLLFGRFDYTDEGVLDRTHLRFFTRRSALGMISASGFEIERVERLRIRDVRKLMHVLIPLPGWRDLWTKQFLFVARRRA